MADGGQLVVDGRTVELAEGDEGRSLLDVLRTTAGITSVKDGCAPQGQCGCCTVLVDGQPRVSCVTQTRRVLGRPVTTVDGLDPDLRARLSDALCATGGSQCGFCTPGIAVRLAAVEPPASGEVTDAVRWAKAQDALQAHLCRCTGWASIVEAAARPVVVRPRDLEAAARRATIEGAAPQRVGPAIALGRGGFADDTAPVGCLVAMLDPEDQWVVADSLATARARAGKVQGRRTTLPLRWPIALPDGDWTVRLATTWVEPAYLEPDCAWCEPGGEPHGPLANGGAFGAKRTSPVVAAARRLADEHGRPVKAVLSREDVVRLGPKRPPLAAGVRADGSGIVRVVRTPGVAGAIAAVAPGLTVEEVDVAGPPTSCDLRGAGWVEAAVLVAAATGAEEIRSPSGATARATIGPTGEVGVTVSCGDVLDATVLRSYVLGAVHQALGMVRSEAIAVDAAGAVHDLTIRSFGILRARDMPGVGIGIVGGGAPVNGSDAAFAAVALAAWRAEGLPDRWPTRRR